MQHWKGISRRHVFVAAVIVLVVGTSTPESEAGRQGFNHWGGTSGEFLAVAGYDWARAMADFSWGSPLADFTWGSPKADFVWGRAVADFDWGRIVTGYD